MSRSSRQYEQMPLPTMENLVLHWKKMPSDEKERVDRMVQKRELLAILEVTKGRTDIPLTKSERELLADPSI